MREYRIPCYLGQEESGEITCQEESLYTTFHYTTNRALPGLYKLRLRGAEGGEMLAGTLFPSGGGLVLQKRLSNRALAQQGLFPPVEGRLVQGRGEAVQTGGGLCPADRVLRQELRAGPRHWQAGETGTFFFPWQPGAQLPLPAAFCFGKPGVCRGEFGLFYRFDPAGELLPPE